MVTIKDYAIYHNSTTGESFVSLILEGDLEMVKSQSTGSYYATTRKCSITSTFDEATAALMVGKQIPGAIVKKKCDPYDYTVHSTGEVIKLDFRYEYAPEEHEVAPAEEEKEQVVEAIDQHVFSSNGTLEQLEA